MEPVRIGRALSMLGAASRREGENLVRGGRVQVNGVMVTDLAQRVTPHLDRVAVDGKQLSWGGVRRYYAVHKPRGVVSTVRDPHAERTVIQLVPSTARLYPVGRLDKDSEGLMLLTDDGDFANRVTHPRYEVEKEYEALVRPNPGPEQLDRLRAGFDLDGKLAQPRRVSWEQRSGSPWIKMVLSEGRKHEVRRLLGAAGFNVERLVRTRIGPVHLGRLAPGEFRELRPREISILRSPPADSPRAATA